MTIYNNNVPPIILPPLPKKRERDSDEIDRAAKRREFSELTENRFFRHVLLQRYEQELRHDHLDNATKLHGILNKTDKDEIKNCALIRSTNNPFLDERQVHLFAVQDYLVNHFETDKKIKMYRIGAKCQELIEQTVLANSNNPNRDDQLIEYIQSQSFILNEKNESERDLNICEEFAKKEREIDHKLDVVRDESSANHPNIDLFVKSLFKSTYTKYFGVGNCYEISNVIFKHLFNEKEIKRFDLYHIEGGDHVFVVVNRKMNSDINDYTTWGKDCWIFDFWAEGKNVFPARDIPNCLKNFTCTLDLNYRPVIEPFNPEEHVLELIVSNIYSSKDFIEITFSNHDTESLVWYQKMLEAFESVDDDLEMKKEIAQKIIDTPIKIEKEENREVVKSLKSQLKFYLDPQSVELYNLNPEPTNRNSIYDDLSIDETVFDNFISNIDVNKLIKIADLLELGDRSAESKLQKLSYRLQETIQQYIKDLSDNDIADSETKADAIYQVILDKADLAQQNGKMEEATKLLCKLPPDFLDDVEDSS